MAFSTSPGYRESKFFSSILPNIVRTCKQRTMALRVDHLKRTLASDEKGSRHRPVLNQPSLLLSLSSLTSSTILSTSIKSQLKLPELSLDSSPVTMKVSQAVPLLLATAASLASAVPITTANNEVALTAIGEVGCLSSSIALILPSSN